jgi:hypothetical protein
MRIEEFDAPLRVDTDFIPLPKRGGHYSKKELQEVLRSVFYKVATHTKNNPSKTFQILADDVLEADEIIKLQCDKLNRPGLYSGFFSRNQKWNVPSMIFGYSAIIYNRMVVDLQPTDFTMRYGTGLVDGWKWNDTTTWTHERLIDWYVSAANSLVKRSYSIINAFAFKIWEPKTAQEWIDKKKNLPGEVRYEAKSWLRTRFGFDYKLFWGHYLPKELVKKYFPHKAPDRVDSDDFFNLVLDGEITISKFKEIEQMAVSYRNEEERKREKENYGYYKDAFMLIGKYLYGKGWKPTQSNISRIFKSGSKIFVGLSNEFASQKPGYRLIPRYKSGAWQLWFKGTDIQEFMNEFAGWLKEVSERQLIGKEKISNAVTLNAKPINAEDYYWNLAGGKPKKDISQPNEKPASEKLSFDEWAKQYEPTLYASLNAKWNSQGTGQKGREAQSAKLREKYDAYLKRKAPAQSSKSIDETDLFEIVKGVHTKYGYEIFTVKIKTKVDSDKFNELRSKAKDNGGYYSSFRGNGAIPGFIFKEEKEALKFAGKTASDDSKQQSWRNDAKSTGTHSFKFNIGDAVTDKETSKNYMVLDAYVENGVPKYTVYPPGKKSTVSYHVWIAEKDLVNRDSKPTQDPERLKLLRLKAKALKLKYKYQ